MSRTTSTPAEAGTVYPPKPSWATRTRVDSKSNQPVIIRSHYGKVGKVREDGQNGLHEVGLYLADWNDEEVSAVVVTVDDDWYTPAHAREFAALLVKAADLAEQS